MLINLFQNMLRIDEYHYKPGTKLVLELINNDLVEGICAIAGKDRIDLINIVINSNNCRIPGPQSYYRSEIKSIRAFTIDQETNKKTSVKADGDDAVILIPQEDYEDLRRMTQEYIYIAMIDTKYYEAVKHLKSCENVGIACITETFDNFALLSILAVSSWDQVYVFDIKSFGLKEFPKELKEILESPHTRKVIHDARLSHGVLQNQYKVEITNIFDTMCADVLIQQNKNLDDVTPPSSKSIAECFKHYFNFPDSFLEIYKVGICMKFSFVIVIYFFVEYPSR